MNRNVRQVTSDLINAVEDGVLDWEEVARAALYYLSEDDVIEMVEINDWNIWIEDEDDDIDDEEKVTAQDVISAAKNYGLTFTEEALKDLEWNVVDFINDDSEFNSADEWMKAIIDGKTEELSDLFVQDVNWKKIFNESITENFDIEIEDEEDALSRLKKGDVLFINNNDGYTAIVPGNKLDHENAYISIDYDLGQKLIDRYDLKLLDREGPDYNQEIYVYKGRIAEEFVSKLSKEALKDIDEIADRYNTSSPVSGKWETEAIHERDTLVRELGYSIKEANQIMIDYLGFDPSIDPAFSFLKENENKHKILESEIEGEELGDNQVIMHYDTKYSDVIFSGTSISSLKNLLKDPQLSKKYKFYKDFVFNERSTEKDFQENFDAYVRRALRLWDVTKTWSYQPSSTTNNPEELAPLTPDFLGGTPVWGGPHGNNDLNFSKTISVGKVSQDLTNKKVTAQEVIDAAKKCGLTFTKEALKDLKWNIVDYINESPTLWSAEDWMEMVIYGGGEDVSDLFEKTGNYRKYFYDPIVGDSITKEDLIKKARDYNLTFTREALKDIESNIIDYINDMNWTVEKWFKEVTSGNTEDVSYLFEKTGAYKRFFNESIDVEFEYEEEDDGTLLNTDYDKLNFHDEGFLIGEMELHYPEVDVFNMFDNEISVDVDLTITVEPEFLLQYICDRNYIDREDLTVVEAQKFIDNIARSPEDYKDYLFDFYYEQAEIKAFKKADLEPDYFSGRRYTEMKENLDELESMLEQNDFEIDFYDGHLTGDVELYYDDLLIIGDEIPSRNRYEPSDWEEIVIDYVYTADVSQSSLVDYILDRFKLDADISNKELQKYIDKIESDTKEFLAYHDYLKEQFRERAEEQASYEEAGKEDDFDGFYEE